MHDLEHCSIPDTVHFVQGMKSDVSSQAEVQSNNKPSLLYLWKTCKVCWRSNMKKKPIQGMNWNLASLHCFLVQDTNASNSKLPMHSMSQLHKTAKQNSVVKVQTQKTSKAAQRQFWGGKGLFNLVHKT